MEANKSKKAGLYIDQYGKPTFSQYDFRPSDFESFFNLVENCDVVISREFVTKIVTTPKISDLKDWLDAFKATDIILPISFTHLQLKFRSYAGGTKDSNEIDHLEKLELLYDYVTFVIKKLGKNPFWCGQKYIPSLHTISSNPRKVELALKIYDIFYPKVKKGEKDEDGKEKDDLWKYVPVVYNNDIRSEELTKKINDFINARRDPKKIEQNPYLAQVLEKRDDSDADPEEDAEEEAAEGESWNRVHSKSHVGHGNRGGRGGHVSRGGHGNDSARDKYTGGNKYHRDDNRGKPNHHFKDDKQPARSRETSSRR